MEEREVPYSEAVLNQIAEHIMNGCTLSKALGRIPVTRPQFARWLANYDEVQKTIDSAFALRAQFLHDKLLDIAEETGAERDEVALAKLKSEIYQVVSKVHNEKFNPKQRSELDHKVGVVAVETGIRRPGDPGYREVTDSVIKKIEDNKIESFTSGWNKIGEKDEREDGEEVEAGGSISSEDEA